MADKKRTKTNKIWLLTLLWLSGNLWRASEHAACCGNSTMAAKSRLKRGKKKESRDALRDASRSCLPECPPSLPPSRWPLVISVWSDGLKDTKVRGRGGRGRVSDSITTRVYRTGNELRFPHLLGHSLHCQLLHRWCHLQIWDESLESFIFNFYGKNGRLKAQSEESEQICERLR